MIERTGEQRKGIEQILRQWERDLEWKANVDVACLSLTLRHRHAHCPQGRHELAKVACAAFPNFEPASPFLKLWRISIEMDNITTR